MNIFQFIHSFVKLKVVNDYYNVSIYLKRDKVILKRSSIVNFLIMHGNKFQLLNVEKSPHTFKCSLELNFIKDSFISYMY